MRSIASLLCACALFAYSNRASAQQYLIGGTAGIASGVEGGGKDGSLYRARTRLRLGGDLRIDESPQDIFGFAVVAEVEPKASIGLDARYMRMLGKRFAVHVGAIGYFAPGSFVGVSTGAEYRIPLSSGVALTMGPELNFFLLGTDLPDGTVVWQGLFQGGIRVDL